MGLPTSAKTIAFVLTADRERAKAFYADTLGFKLVREDNFAAVFDLNGVMMRLTMVPNFTAHGHTVLGWDVTDIAAAVSVLREKGVAFNVYEGFGQDPMGIWSSPAGGAKVAWFCDPDGNVLSITQF